MLQVYRLLLKPGGQIHMKTDQEGMFRYTLKELVRDGWSVGKMTRDLYRSGFEGNVATEYERRFVSQGQPIFRLEAWSGYGES
jgi:tRNA (guanine-N7-)-methyltransferase